MAQVAQKSGCANTFGWVEYMLTDLIDIQIFPNFILEYSDFDY